MAKKATDSTTAGQVTPTLGTTGDTPTLPKASAETRNAFGNFAGSEGSEAHEEPLEETESGQQSEEPEEETSGEEEQESSEEETEEAEGDETDASTEGDTSDEDDDDDFSPIGTLREDLKDKPKALRYIEKQDKELKRVRGEVDALKTPATHFRALEESLRARTTALPTVRDIIKGLETDHPGFRDELLAELGVELKEEEPPEGLTPGEQLLWKGQKTLEKQLRMQSVETQRAQERARLAERNQAEKARYEKDMNLAVTKLEKMIPGFKVSARSKTEAQAAYPGLTPDRALRAHLAEDIGRFTAKAVNKSQVPSRKAPDTGGTSGSSVRRQAKPSLANAASTKEAFRIVNPA